ncbi:MAG: hemolysin III family protein [Clostridiales bacterium]|nr:hemolysin III family protein [Clostridiales bacterium]
MEGIMKLKDPGSAITHFIGFAAGIPMMVILLLYSIHQGAGREQLVCYTIFMCSMLLLYAASTTYHSLKISDRVDMVLKKIDHMMIFVLIAGTYTPCCLLYIGGSTGKILLTVVYALSAIGILMKALWVTCPKWVSSVIYISLGWSCIFAFPQILSSVTPMGFFWLLAGGILYTVGGVIYALKFPVFHDRFRYFGTHELFHVFVLGGSLCHYLFMFQGTI